MVDTNEHRPGADPGACAGCGARLVTGQRYCLRCGTRHGDLAACIGALLATAGDPGEGRARRLAMADAPVLPSVDPDDVGVTESSISPWAWTGGVPAPRSLAVAVLATMAFGIAAGSFDNPTIDRLASAPLLLLVTGHATQQPAAAPAAPAPLAAPTDTSASTDGGVETITETIGSAAAAPAAPAAGSAVAGAGGVSAPATVYAPPPPVDGSSPGAPNSLLGLPPIRHVFVIVLSDAGYSRTFSPLSGDRYLSHTLPAEGEVLGDYYAVAGSGLANGIALLSGQGPTPQTLADCPAFSEIAPGTVAKDGQILGDGCGYPAAAETLPTQLIANGFTPKEYIDGLSAARDAAACHRPPAGVPDPDHTSEATHPYVSWRNPFTYFDALATSPGCGGADQAPLARLAEDLRMVPTTPAFSLIVPSPCEDGSATPCAPQAPAGLAPADAFLKRALSIIRRSPAYQQDGLIAITSDEAPQTGADADPSACCSTPAYPNVPAATAVTTSTTGTPTSATTTGTPNSATTGTTGAATGDSATSTSATSTSAASTSTTSTVSTTSTSTTANASTTGTPPPDASGGQTTPTGGGGQVGLLLLSRFVKPGTNDLVDYFNHYSLLGTIESIFSLPRLGYAADPALPLFDANIFNYRKPN